jgi:hypothetical protein
LPIKEGEQFIRGFIPDQEAADTNLQRPPVVATSKHLYNEICITFSPSIENAEGDKESEVCNLITEYKGRPTSVANAFGTVGSANFPEPTEADFNEAII